MSTDPRRVPTGIVAANGWHREPGDPEQTCNAGDIGAVDEVTVYYSGDDGRFAEETYYVEADDRTGRLSVWQMSHVGQWAPDDPEHESEPLHEEYIYESLGLYDYADDEQGRADAIRERDRFAAGDESDSYTF